MASLSVLISQNDRLTKQEKNRFHITYLAIAGAAVSEWASLALNGAPGWTIPLHQVCKCMDYTLTPVASILFIRQLTEHSRFRKAVMTILGINAVFEILSLFTGWTFYVDGENYYHHGPLNFIYMIIYMLVVILVVVEVLRYGRGFKRQNRISMYSIAVVVLLSILVQEVINAEMRVIYMGLAFGSVLLFVHYSEFSQQKKDDDMTAQQRLLETDSLTGLFSRYAYTQALAELEKDPAMLLGVTAFSIDVDGLKGVNDRMGHLAGDELIIGSAECIAGELAPYGRCYRTGGDEFIAIVKVPDGQAEELKQRIVAAARNWHGKQVKQISLSVGYAAADDRDGVGIEKLIYEADQQMSVEKNRYYQEHSLQRRG